MKTTLLTIGLLSLALFVSACDSNDPDDDDGGGAGEVEVISNVVLTFESTNTGTAQTFEAVFDEAGELQEAETDAITLTVGQTYAVSVDLRNRFASDADEQDITAEIRDEEPDAHRFFYAADPNTLLTVSNLNSDPAGNPLGLTFDAVTTASAGTGTFRVKLRHYEEDAVLPGDKLSDTIDAPEVAGVVETDVDISFDLTVQAAASSSE